MTKQTKIIVTVALMLSIALTALDVTIVGTAMPSIVGKLGGITLYSWVFSAYLLTSTTTIPIYGKLADLYGRKPLLLFGLLFFRIGLYCLWGGSDDGAVDHLPCYPGIGSWGSVANRYDYHR